MLKQLKKHTDKLHQICIGNYYYRTWHGLSYAKFFHLLIAVIFLIGVGIGLTPQILSYIVQVKAASGNIDSVDKYAWSENLGWINFRPTGGGVTVSDTGLTGYAWSENAGWINMNPTYGGVINDGVGGLSGYAWSENAGWINFNPTGSQVVITSQAFTGYAWGENTGWISFNCSNTNTCAEVDYKVKTVWVVPVRGDITPPASVANIEIQATSEGITLTWIDPSDSDFTSVIILRGQDPMPVSGTTYSVVTKGRQSFTDTDVIAGATYKYIIRSQDSSGNIEMNETIYSAVALKAITPAKKAAEEVVAPVETEEIEEAEAEAEAEAEEGVPVEEPIEEKEAIIPKEKPEEEIPTKPKEEAVEPIILPVVSLTANDLIKGTAQSVYYYGPDSKKYLFSNQATFLTWYKDFSQVKTISDSQLSAVSFGGYVTYRPGVRMVKISTDVKVYAVVQGGILRWIENEVLAEEIYGVDWNQKIDDLPIDIFNRNYTFAETITDASQYNPAAQKAGVPDIKTDLGL